MISIVMPVDLDGRKIELEKPLTARKLLRKLSLSPESYLVVVNERLAADDEILNNEDEVKIIRVVSGG